MAAIGVVAAMDEEVRCLVLCLVLRDEEGSEVVSVFLSVYYPQYNDSLLVLALFTHHGLMRIPSQTKSGGIIGRLALGSLTNVEVERR